MMKNLLAAWRPFYGVLLVVCLLVAGLLPGTVGAIEVGGEIAEDVIWGLSDSPYVLKEDVQVGSRLHPEHSVVLTIKAGVSVKMNGFHIRMGSLPKGNHPGSQGRFIAEGAKFFGKGDVLLAHSQQSIVSKCVFDQVDLVLGADISKNSSGSIRQTTLKDADIDIRSGQWEIVGGKMLNGKINSAIPSLLNTTPQATRVLKSLHDLVILP